ncbi:aminodeoxychorismate synthase component I [Actinomadura macrotermitis]|uniref:aminodeoxychorismate synthase component I n=1 Tax=Actinomadura macrotermitis TaxID=2585200 RepID=UPI002E275139
MPTLLIDNYDSYTYNLFQLLAAVNGIPPVVFHNDDPRLPELELRDFDSIVISPGPGRPQAGRDLGHVTRLLEEARAPVLGVCLGHQALAHMEGGDVVPALLPRHGHLTVVRHDGDGLFEGIPQNFRAVRYHSLVVAEPLPDSLVATAWAEDGMVMGLRHKHLPRWGVQFHPESIATEHGERLLANFRDLAAAVRESNGHRRPRTLSVHEAMTPGPLADPSTVAAADEEPMGLAVEVRALPGAVPTERAFEALYRDGEQAFWLDSSRVEPGLSRFSFMGDFSGPLSEVLTYRVPDDKVTVTSPDGTTRLEPGDIFEVLERRLATHAVDSPDGLPFDFSCGYVGYFGYELKANCGGDYRHASATPDATWMLADRLVAVDHQEDQTYVLTLNDGSNKVRRANAAWTERMLAALSNLLTESEGEDPRADPAPPAAGGSEADPLNTRGRPRYLEDVAECRRLLAAGESYEICLTDKIRTTFDGDRLAFYHRLRSVNPAPYGALLRFGDLTVFCSSPERFLRIDTDRLVETKPIKGTAPRSDDPLEDARLHNGLATSAKAQAENLMIVDLLRNDLGRTCEIGSVQVPSYMAVESYATVHQLVSTITGRLRREVSPVACVRACFPGGSMTGAPKLRTMEIIDRLEHEARGVYSGALGYFGLNGTADLSIVIRTAVLWKDDLTVGAGGAVVYGSTPVEEYDEMVLKASATLRALASLQSTTTAP